MKQFHSCRFRLDWLFLLVLVSLAFVCLGVGTTYAADGCGGQTLTPSISQDDALEVIHLLNLERRAQQLPPYKTSDTLLISSQYHVVDMSKDGYFNMETHDVIDGVLTPVELCDSPERIRSFYDSSSEPDDTTTVLGVSDFRNAEELLSLWLMVDSTSTALLSSDYREIGVGIDASQGGIATNAVGDMVGSGDEFPLVIENEAVTTDDHSVNLYVYGQWDEIRLRNEAGVWSEWFSFSNDLSWELSAGNGEKIVSAEMRNNDPNATYSSASAIPDHIEVAPASEIPVPPTPTSTSEAPSPTVPTFEAPVPPTSTPLPPIDENDENVEESGSNLTLIQTVNNDNLEISETIEFDIMLTDTMASTPIITATLPDGLTLSSFTSNNLFRPTQTIDDRTVVWQPRVDPTLPPLNYPARLTIRAIVESDSSDEYELVITTADAITLQDSGDQSSLQVDQSSSDIPLNTMVNSIEAMVIPSSFITLILGLALSALTVTAYRRRQC